MTVENDADVRRVLILPAAILLIGAFLVPVAWFLIRSFTDPSLGLSNFESIFSGAIYARVASNTVVISLTVTLFCFLLGFPLAHAIASSTPRMRKLLMIAILIPLWTSLLVRSFAWMVLLQDNGIVNSILVHLGVISEPVRLIYNRIGVLLAMVQVLLPFMVLPLYSIMTRIDPRLLPAAATLGASPVSSFFQVYLPLTLPGVISGCSLVFVLSLGYYITPALVGGRGDTMIGQLIVLQVGELGNWGIAAALGVALLVATSLIALIVGLLTRKSKNWKAA